MSGRVDEWKSGEWKSGEWRGGVRMSDVEWTEETEGAKRTKGTEGDGQARRKGARERASARSQITRLRFRKEEENR
jgi:hypothetical protein